MKVIGMDSAQKKRNGWLAYVLILVLLAHVHSCQQLFTLSFHIILRIKVEEEFFYWFLGPCCEIMP